MKKIVILTSLVLCFACTYAQRPSNSGVRGNMSSSRGSVSHSTATRTSHSSASTTRSTFTPSHGTSNRSSSAMRTPSSNRQTPSGISRQHPTQSNKGGRPAHEPHRTINNHNTPQHRHETGVYGGKEPVGHPHHGPAHHNRPPQGMHPTHYHHHPYHRHYVSMHRCYWHDPCLYNTIFWYGMWEYSYMNNYDRVIISSYANPQYNTTLIDIANSGDFVYILFDEYGDRYLGVMDRNDQMVAKQRVSGRYITLIPTDGGYGCWLFKKRHKSGILFVYEGNTLEIYEED